MKLSNRNIHRDVAYFYVGLLIAFSFSGIILNHRQDWYPMDYTYDQIDITMDLPSDVEEIDREFFRSFESENNVEYEDHRVRDAQLRVFFKGNGILDLDTSTGKGILEFKRKVPFLGHTMFLHKTTNSFWVWYSDIFGAAMLLIAITGMLIPIGKNGFKSRGWKLALAGMLFPLIFLFFLS